MSPADVPDVTVVKAIAGYLGVDLAGADPEAVAFAIRPYEDRMRRALAAVLPEIQAQAVREVAALHQPRTDEGPRDGYCTTCSGREWPCKGDDAAEAGR